MQVYAIDFDTAAQAIKRLRGRDPSVKVICYFSAGSWENYRGGEDKNRRGILPSDWLRPDGSSTIGRAMDGWPGERWVDVRSEEVRGVMRKRLDYCRDIGCDGVDPGALRKTSPACAAHCRRHASLRARPCLPHTPLPPRADNVNGHENNTGFKLTKQDLVQVTPGALRCSAAHGAGAVATWVGGDQLCSNDPLCAPCSTIDGWRSRRMRGAWASA